MAPPKPPIPKAADANLSRVFDPWNSVGAGHQRPETKGPGGWRESRALKMNSQLVAGNSGGKRIHDTVGAGSLDFDAKLNMVVPREVRARAKCSVADMLRRQGSGSATEKEVGDALPGGSRPSSSGSAEAMHSVSVSPTKKSNPSGIQVAGQDFPRAASEDTAMDDQTQDGDENGDTDREKKQRRIFDNLVVYVNGSTHPIISDHRLKHLLAENGARMSFHLGRRQVTHVILGRPATVGRGAGGGLAGGKLDKEIRKVGGCGIKYVGVEWVLESIKAGKRLPEARFANLKVAPRGQQSVYGAFAGAAGVKSADAASAQGQPPR